jgi:glycosyltransferase involved in cell wall biosynthesis
MRVGIIYPYFFDPDGVELRIGGVETYLFQLTRLCADLGLDPIIFQSAKVPFARTLEHVSVIGVTPKWPKRGCTRQGLFEAAVRTIELTKDILIFGTDHFSVPVLSGRCVAIQHGVNWDLPAVRPSNRRWNEKGVAAAVWKSHLKRYAFHAFRNCVNRVCVDYNFLNWYRASFSAALPGNVWIIPNFAEIAQRDDLQQLDRSDTVKVLFARRFTEYRGTRIMAEAARQLLAYNTTVAFTFAGEGPDSEWLKSAFAREPRVQFVKFDSRDAVRVNAAHDIAVVPSLGSEGTSFSVAEAMGAGRAVIATNVGGITNMIISGYNGILVNPDAESLVCALKTLVDNHLYRRQLGMAAYETAKHAFSLARWRDDWKAVLRVLGTGHANACGFATGGES